jgi:molecular chaperone GrpE
MSSYAQRASIQWPYPSYAWPDSVAPIDGMWGLAKFGKRNRDTGLGAWDARQPVALDPGSVTQEQTRTISGTQQEIIERLELIEQQAGEYHRRSAHAESIIDRLHAENQQLRDNARSSVFEPVAADLIRLYDSLTGEAQRLAAAETVPAIAKLMMSFADDVELALDRCGFEPVRATAGDPFILGEHAAAAVDITDDERLNNTVARVVATGLRDKATGLVRRPLKVRVYRIANSSDPSGSNSERAISAPGTERSKEQETPGGDQGELHNDDLRD